MLFCMYTHVAEVSILPLLQTWSSTSLLHCSGTAKCEGCCPERAPGHSPSGVQNRIAGATSSLCWEISQWMEGHGSGVHAMPRIGTIQAALVLQRLGHATKDNLVWLGSRRGHPKSPAVEYAGNPSCECSVTDMARSSLLPHFWDWCFEREWANWSRILPQQWGRALCFHDTDIPRSPWT